MSGLWSYRSACDAHSGRSANDGVPDIVRYALPLAGGYPTPSLPSGGGVASPAANDNLYPCDPSSRDDEFLCPSEAIKDGRITAPEDYEEEFPMSNQSWLHGIAESVAEKQQLDPGAYCMERILLDLRQHGGELHGRLSSHPPSSNVLQHLDTPDAPLLAATVDSPSDQELLLRMLETAKTAVNLPGRFEVAPRHLTPTTTSSTSSNQQATHRGRISATSVEKRQVPPGLSRRAHNEQKKEAAQLTKEVQKERRAERDALRAESRNALESVALNKKRAEEEVERRKCIEAISNIQRCRQRLQASPATAPHHCRQVKTSSSPPSNEFCAPPPSKASGASPCTPESSRLQDVRSCSHSSSSPNLTEPSIPSWTAPSCSSNESLRHISFRDPKVRLAASLQRRNEQIQAIQSQTASGGPRASPIALDDRIVKQQRLQAFTLRTAQRAERREQEKTAAMQAVQLRVDAHNQLRLVWYYAWLPWRKWMLVRSLSIKNASTLYNNTLTRTVFHEWRTAAKSSRHLSFVVSCARTVALQRFFWWCWKRRVFLYWRSVVLLQKARIRDADRLRKRLVINRWKSALQNLQTRRSEKEDSDVSKFMCMRIRQCKRRLWNSWCAAFEARCLERERNTFRTLLASVAQEVEL